MDPIDGTRMAAMGQSNALSVLAAGGKNIFESPDMYMEKLVGQEVERMVDLCLPLLNKIYVGLHQKWKITFSINSGYIR